MYKLSPSSTVYISKGYFYNDCSNTRTESCVTQSEDKTNRMIGLIHSVVISHSHFSRTGCDVPVYEIIFYVQRCICSMFLQSTSLEGTVRGFAKFIPSNKTPSRFTRDDANTWPHAAVTQFAAKLQYRFIDRLTPAVINYACKTRFSQVRY